MNTKIDINQIVGFLLIGAIILYFTVFNPAQSEGAAANTQSTADTTVVENGAIDEPPSENEGLSNSETSIVLGDTSSTDSLGYLKAVALYGPFAKQMIVQKEPEFYDLENELLRLKFSSKGAQIVEAELKDYRTYDSLPLYIIQENSNFGFDIQAGQLRSTADLKFSLSAQGGDFIEFSAQTDDGARLIYRYQLPSNEYRLNLDIQSEGLSQILANANSSLLFELKGKRHEKNKANEIQSSEMQYRLIEDQDIESLNTTSKDEESAEQSFDWVAYKQQFFSTILQSRGSPFANADLAIASLEEEGYTKYYAANIQYPKASNGDINLPLSLYIGPNKFEILESYETGFEELVPLGWGILGWINRGLVLNVFNFLEDYGINYGLIILIIAVLIKMVLFPLTYSSYRSMAKMRVLKPEIDELNEKYDDAAKKQQAQLELYNKAGVSPLGGCLPMLLQFPILIALFRFFPSSIELRQQPFLWATDLSTYDSIYDLPFDIPFYGDHVSLFTLLMTVSTLIYTWMNQQLTGSAQNAQFPQMKYIIYFMPIMFLGVFNSYAAGLSYYYFVANMITFGQQYAIRSFIDEDKIKEKIAKRKEGPQKENRLMRRMKDVQEQQNRQQRRTKK